METVKNVKEATVTYQEMVDNFSKEISCFEKELQKFIFPCIVSIKKLQIYQRLLLNTTDKLDVGEIKLPEIHIPYLDAIRRLNKGNQKIMESVKKEKK